MPVIINISTWIKRIIMLLYIISPVNTDENTIRICFEKRKSDIFSNIPGRNIEGTKYPEIYEDIIIMEKYDIMLKCSLLKSPPRKWEKAAENKHNTSIVSKYDKKYILTGILINFPSIKMHKYIIIEIIYKTMVFTKMFNNVWLKYENPEI